MEAQGYLYKTTWIPEGLMYFGSRKLPEGVTASEDTGYMGSPKGTSKMLELRETRPESEFAKVILYEGKYDDVRELEPLLIKEAWDKWGKYSDGGLVTCLAAGKQVIQTAEIKAKISAAKKGKKYGPRSAETRAKISAALKGKPLSAETKAKISASTKAYWAKRKATSPKGV